MRNKINNFIDWFESKFNFIIDIIALIGGLFTISFAIIVFISFLVGRYFVQYEVILVPGFLGFLGIIMLFALRITRHLTKK